MQIIIMPKLKADALSGGSLVIKHRYSNRKINKDTSPVVSVQEPTVIFQATYLSRTCETSHCFVCGFVAIWALDRDWELWNRAMFSVFRCRTSISGE